MISETQCLLDQYQDAYDTAEQLRDEEKQRPTNTPLQRLMADLASEKCFHERCMIAAERILSQLRPKLAKS